MRVFIGYDSNEVVAYHVLAHSIISRASIPVSIQPVMLSQLRGIYTRARGPHDSTEFSNSRFLVPYLSGYTGQSIFMDCDMLCLWDIAELVKHTDDTEPVFAVQHNYAPKSEQKFLNQPQTTYSRKNWSSLMVFNNYLCQALTPEYVSSAPGLDLHQFKWASNVGGLPTEWNHLVGEYPDRADAKILHYTLGGPWFAATRNEDRAADWFAEKEKMLCAT